MVALRGSSLSRIVTLFLCLVLFGVVIALPAPVQGQGGPPPRLNITLALPEGELAWGTESTFTVTVSNEGSEVATGVQLQLSRNRALVYTGAVAAPAAAVPAVTVELGDIAAGVSRVTAVGLRVVGVPRNGWAWVHAQAKGVGTPAANAKERLAIQPFAAQETTIPLTGGLLDAEDGRVAIAFPPGWHETEATVSFQLDELYQKLTDDAGTLVSFSVEANAGGPVEAFNVPVTVVIQIGDLLPGEGEEAEGLMVYTHENSEESYQAVAALYSAATGTLTFTTTHFSTFLLAVDPAPWQFGYTPPGASAFSGAGTYRYPIAVPAGIGGLTPDLTLHYNNRAVDGLEFPVMAGGFGLGWSLPQAEIVNGNAARMYDPNDDGENGQNNFSPDYFTLMLGGVSYRLDPHDGVGRYGRYTALGGSALYVELIRDDNNNQQNNTNNITGEFWRVRTADGTTYTFGFTLDAEQSVAPMNRQPIRNIGQHRNANFAAVSWKLNSVVDVNGRQITYHYEDECGIWFNPPGGVRNFSIAGGQHCTEVDTALKEIRYNFNEAAQTIITFTYQEGFNPDPVKQEKLMTAGHFRPTEIAIKQNGNIIGRYLFGYGAFLGEHHIGNGWDTTTQFWMLETITRVGSNGNTLPVETYSYEHDANGCADAVCAKLLTRVKNGYGGVTEMSYALSSDRWYHVWDIRRWDGVIHQHGASGEAGWAETRVQIDRSAYAPCYDKALHNSQVQTCYLAGWPESGALVGFTGAIITTSEPASATTWTVLRRERWEFSIQDYWRNGRVTKHEHLVPNTNPPVVLTRETQTWTQWGGTPQLTQRVMELIGSGTAVWNKTTYTYLNGAGHYGAVDEVKEYDVLANGTDSLRRCTKYVYGHKIDQGAWLINRPLSEKTFPGACSGTEVARTLYRYGQSMVPTDTTIGILGQLTWILRWDGSNYLTEKSTYHTSGQSLGLLKDTIVFSQGATDSAYPPSTSERNTVRLTYSNMGMVTQSQRIPASGTTLTEVFSYSTLFPWLVTAATDPAGRTVKYAYDPFGRLAEVAYPGDDVNNASNKPTFSYTYYDNGSTQLLSPFRVDTFYKKIANVEILEDERRFYDGFGRLVQEQKRRFEVDGPGEKDILVTYGYEARGLQVCQTVPYAVNPYGGSGTPYKADACTSKERTIQPMTQPAG